MTAKTFFHEPAKCRLIVTRDGNYWAAEVRSAFGSISVTSGKDWEQTLGHCYILASQRSGSYSEMAALFAQADEAIERGDFGLENPQAIADAIKHADSKIKQAI